MQQGKEGPPDVHLTRPKSTTTSGRVAQTRLHTGSGITLGNTEANASGTQPDFRARPGEVSHCQGDSISFRHYGEGPDQLLTGLMTSADIFSVE